MAKLFIGMPVFNGEKYVEQAIDSLLKQSYQDWQLLISDNCSTDKTLEICQRKARDDQRISIFCQSDNIGAMNNFKFLVEQSSGEYFMWAAADDLWHENFIEKLITGLEENGDCGMAFCNPVIINSGGKIVDMFLPFKRFTSDNQIDTVTTFLRDPEISGKANLVYSVYRTEFIKQLYKIYPMNEHWGTDMIFVFCCLCRTKLFICDDVLFFKRERHYKNNKEAKINIADMTHGDNYIFPLKYANEYINDIILTAKDTPYERLAETIMMLRKDLLKRNIIMKIKRIKLFIVNIFILIKKFLDFSRYEKFINKLQKNNKRLIPRVVFKRIKELINGL
ncbi:MAG: glycosyltransferase family 2 protein [Patescibacteria group bacterium]|nr:glycosyltransferase family 2 protein [Patescibacteria group bacterium]